MYSFGRVMLLSRKMESKPSGATLKRKRKYGKLSLDQKIQIIRAAEMGYSQRTLASQYNCGKTQVHLLVTQKELWLAKWERSRKGDSWSRVRGTPSVSEINSLVWDFYKKACSHEIDVTVNMLLERAKQVAHALNVHNFDADLEWLEKFKKEFNVTLPLSLEQDHEESKDGDFESLFLGYDKKNVYYFGMAELYHRSLPCVGQKSQDHITMCFCISASGEKEIISFVFCENACAEAELWNVQVPCFSSPMGQVTLEVYQHSLNVLNQKMSQLDRKVLLYVNDDQFPPEIEKVMSNVEIHNCPWAFDVQEVINNYRLLYCHRLMSSLAASNFDQWDVIGQKVKSLSMSKIMRIVQSSWKQISSKLVVSSFRNRVSSAEEEQEHQDINRRLLEDIQKLVVLIKQSDNEAGSCDPDGVFNIAEEILSQELPELADKELEEIENRDEMDHTDESEDIMQPLSKSDVFSSILKLEIFIQSMPESSKRNDALDILESLERTMQDLLIADKETQDKMISLDSIS